MRRCHGSFISQRKGEEEKRRCVEGGLTTEARLSGCCFFFNHNFGFVLIYISTKTLTVLRCLYPISLLCNLQSEACLVFLLGISM